jgi:hypothetical protein
MEGMEGVGCGAEEGERMRMRMRMRLRKWTEKMRKVTRA